MSLLFSKNRGLVNPFVLLFLWMQAQAYEARLFNYCHPTPPITDGVILRPHYLATDVGAVVVAGPGYERGQPPDLAEGLAVLDVLSRPTQQPATVISEILGIPAGEINEDFLLQKIAVVGRHYGARTNAHAFCSAVDSGALFVTPRQKIVASGTKVDILQKIRQGFRDEEIAEAYEFSTQKLQERYKLIADNIGAASLSRLFMVRAAYEASILRPPIAGRAWVAFSATGRPRLGPTSAQLKVIDILTSFERGDQTSQTPAETGNMLDLYQRLGAKNNEHAYTILASLGLVAIEPRPLVSKRPPRKAEIRALSCTALGLTVSAAAEHLGMAYDTVKTELAWLMRTISVPNRAAAVRRLFEAGIFVPARSFRE